MKFNLKQGYQQDKSTAWVVSREFVKRARKLKVATTTGGNDLEYIWQPGLTDGAPDRILDIPYNMSEYAPNTFTTGLYVAVLGSFRFYRIAQVADMMLQRLVELYAATNEVGFIGRRWVDGAPGPGRGVHPPQAGLTLPGPGRVASPGPFSPENPGKPRENHDEDPRRGPRLRRPARRHDRRPGRARRRHGRGRLRRACRGRPGRRDGRGPRRSRHRDRRGPRDSCHAQSHHAAGDGAGRPPKAKQHLRVDIDDDDDLIYALVGAARETVEGWTARSLITTAWRLTLDGFVPRDRQYRPAGSIPERYYLYPSSWPVVLPRADVIAVTAITYVDVDGTTRTLDPSAYQVVTGAPGFVLPAYGLSWPSTRYQPESVTIDFTAGYGDTAADVPNVAKSAIKLLLGHLYENREATVTSSIGLREAPLGVKTLVALLDWGYYP
jgi:hypothetical protein